MPTSTPTYINHRYKVLQQLGKGGMGTVYLVEDSQQSNQIVAIKTLSQDVLADCDLAQFKHEFAALAQLRHPNLVSVYDFGSTPDSREYYFTMEFAPGEDLPSLVSQRPHHLQSPNQYTWLYEIVVQVCRALQYIHSRGFIHYDVKPRNIRIAPNGQVKLMDFGLIGEARPRGRQKARGTPDYIAPELLRGEDVDHRADLYSLGVTMYEIVTGCLPFPDHGKMGALRQHLDTPELPEHFTRDIPKGLQTLILTLLEKEPANRFASANQVIQAINDLSGLEFPVETKESKRGYIQGGGFIGREFELARLQGLLMRSMQGQGRLALISGAAGMGKLRLARELRQRAQLQRALVCEGACDEQVRVPYRPWLSIFGQLLAYYQRTKHPLLRTHGGAILRLMPELAAQVGPETRLEEWRDDKQSLVEATAQFMLGCDQPLVIILSELQYADTETVELLNLLGQRAAQARLLLCGVFCDDEIETGNPMGLVIRQARLMNRQGEAQSGSTEPGEAPYDLLRLDPLDEAGVSNFVKSMLGSAGSQDTPLPPGLLPRLMAETGGNPLFIETIMHSLVEEDLLQFDGEKWNIDTATLSLPATIQEAARRRLERLDEEILQVLQWAAVMGQWLDMAVLAEVCGLPSERMHGLVHAAIMKHVLASGEQAGEKIYRFSDEQMREVVYQTIPPEQRAERHQRTGEVLRRLYDENEIAQWLAWHFDRAGEPGQALHYFALAAAKAGQAYANESAIQYYTQALRLVHQNPGLADHQTHYDLLAGREACYNLVGNRRAQQTDLDEMALVANEMGDLGKQIQVVTRQSTLANLLGNHARAQFAAEAAVELARQSGDRRLEADSLHMLGEAYYGVSNNDSSKDCHDKALRIYVELGNRQGEAQSLRRLGRVHLRLGNPAQAIQHHEQALRIYRSIGDQRGESDALTSLGATVTDFAQARGYHEQALALRQATGDLAGQATTYNNLAMIYWSMGLYSRARDYMEQAVQIERELQDRSGLGYCLETLGRVYLDLGDFSQAQLTLEEGRLLCQETGDRWTETTYWIMLCRVALARGCPQEALEIGQKGVAMLRELKALELATCLAWLGKTHLELGDWENAYACTKEAVERYSVCDNAGDYPNQDVFWLHYQVLRADPRRQGNETLDGETWACLQQAHQVMLAGIASLSDEGLRRNYLNKVKINNDIITEWTRQAAKRAGEQIDIAAPEAVVEGEATAAAEAQRAQDKLKRVLDISVQMNETHDAESLLNYVMDQVTELSGAERSFLVLQDSAGQMDFKVARGMAQDEIERAKAQISYTVLGVVAQSKMPVLLQDALTDERFGRQSSVLELNLRSVLCVPLLTRFELVGMIYADNRSISGRFSQADVDLMAIFANQAASAIENARLYQETVRANKELEAWAHTLEQRVNERTAELQQANAALSRRAVQLETSSQVGQHATSILDLQDLLTQVVELIQVRFRYYFVGIWLVSKERDTVLLHAGISSLGPSRPTQLPSISMDTTSIIVGVCKSGQYRLENNVSAASDFLLDEELPDTRSEMTLPLRMGNTTIGALDIQSDQAEAFGPDDLMTLQTLADQVTIAIRNAQLYEAEHDRRRLAEALEQSGRQLSSSLDLYEVPGRILEQLAQVTPYERGSVFLQEGDQVRIIAQRGFPERELALELRMPIHEGDVYQQVVQKRSPVLVDDVTQMAGWQQVDWLPLNKSWVGVPLISKDRVIGMISLTRSKANAFSQDDAMLASTFAVQAAIALENASLYAEITRFNEQLEQMVQRRTEELNKAYLNLERLDKTKSDFIEVAAHELRTPLTVIKGYTQVVQELPALKDDANTKPLLAGILNGANRLHEIVNSMLDVSKIDSQSLRMQKEAIPLSAVIGCVHSELDKVLNDRRMEFEQHGLKNLPMVVIDPDLMFKVFYQLIGNAIKYTPDGGKITVIGRCLGNDTPDGQKIAQAIEVVVCDTGIGIDPANHELIFDKFFQTGPVAFHSSGRTKFKGGGPGLGLAIARGIVEAHNGKIWVESPGYDEENCPGSKFHILLNV